MNKLLPIISIFILVQNLTINAQDAFSEFENLFSKPKNYWVCKTDSEILIDGKGNEPAWNNAAWTEDFTDIEGDLKPAPLYQTRVKMLWDNENLYILAELEEPQIWAYYTKHDLIVYHENDFEIFIDPDNDTRNYFEIEINAQNTVFDLFMTKPYRDRGIPLITWNATGLTTAIHIDGTLNNFSDRDKKWTVEMAIPFETLKLGVHKAIPQNGQSWRINFSRVQWQTEIENNQYVRKKDPATDKILPENNWVWSPIGVINMHYPERWGNLQFSTEYEYTEGDSQEMDAEDKLRDYLWLVYYKQKKFLSENGNYATSLNQISVQESVKTDLGENGKIEMFASKLQFIARLTSSEGKIITIDHEGFIQSVK
ncbi:MAG: carbohydrate-binding family 9-like protein [Draconibacterium sp.]